MKPHYDIVVNSWYTDVINITGYSAIRTPIGTYVSLTFKCLSEVIAGSNIPFFTVTESYTGSYACAYGSIAGVNSLIYPHDDYNYAFMIRTHETLLVDIFYYTSILIPFA